jgi:hypothetical protein
MKGESGEKRGKKTQQREAMRPAPEAPPILGERSFETQLSAAPSEPAPTTDARTHARAIGPAQITSP